MKIEDANHLLTFIRGNSIVNMLNRHPYGVISEAVRTIFRAKSATKEMTDCAGSVEATLLRYKYGS